MIRLDNDESSMHGVKMTTRNYRKVRGLLKPLGFRVYTRYILCMAIEGGEVILSTNRSHDQQVLVTRIRATGIPEILEIGIHDTIDDALRHITDWRASDAAKSPP